MLLGTPVRFSGAAGALPGRTLGGTSRFSEQSSDPFGLSSEPHSSTPRHPSAQPSWTPGHSFAPRSWTPGYSSAPHSWTPGYSSAPRSWTRGYSSAPRSWMPVHPFARPFWTPGYSSAPCADPSWQSCGPNASPFWWISVRIFVLTSCLSCFPTTRYRMSLRNRMNGRARDLTNCSRKAADPSTQSLTSPSPYHEVRPS